MLSPKQTARIGRLVKKAMRLRGGGSALPGLIVEKIHPGFLAHALSDLPHGVVVVTGTNGKTTTTKMVTQLLRSEGLKVFTNPSGSNFTRGIVASLLSHVNKDGKLDADIAVIELDEAYAVHFAKQVAPRYTLVLNVFRDQLDRFGEVDYTAKLLAKVVEATTGGIVLNRDDSPVRDLATLVNKTKKIQYFGYDETLARYFPSDADLHGISDEKITLPPLSEGDVVLRSLSNHSATFSFGNHLQPSTKLRIEGIYNVLNVAAALALVRMIRGKACQESALLQEVATVKPAFGRGEAIDIDGKPLEIVLVKNPSGFRLAIESYKLRPADTMIVINDQYADGRDMSWLWDVNFESFQKSGINVVSGIRAYDMALRLQYEEVTVSYVDTSIENALKVFLKDTGSMPKRIFCTYTAMLAVRRSLSRHYHLEPIE